MTGYRERIRGAVPDAPLCRADRRWLGWSLLVGSLVALLYIATNEYPAYGAGLYTLTADTIRANGYALPATVPHYGPEGVPFAYPPLAFYGLAVLRSLGAPIFATALVVPPLVTVAALVPAYLLGRDIVGDRRAGTAVALLVAVNPQTIEWHISAGGLVRAPAFCFALCGAYAALRIFRDGDREWVPVGLVAVLLVALTHPTYTIFTVATFLVFWVGYDRSLVGFARGAVVGFGALALATPWLLTVVDIHGVAVFSGAAGTHGGIGGGLYRLRAWGPTSAIVPAVAALGLLVTRYRTVGLWTIVVWLLFAQPRFALAAGAVTLVASVVVLGEYADARSRSIRPDEPARLALALLVAVSVVGVGGVGYEFAGPGDGTTPAFVDDADVAAMAWAGESTPRGATFVVLGDAAEWFPVVSDRTILVSPWGAEWRGPDSYGPQLRAFRTVSHCDNVTCVERATAAVDADPDYLYLPKDGYTVRGGYRWADGNLTSSFTASSDYERAFENDGVVVFRAVE
jgi:hypothetical protein